MQDQSNERSTPVPPSERLMAKLSAQMQSKPQPPEAIAASLLGILGNTLDMLGVPPTEKDAIIAKVIAVGGGN